MNTYGKLVGGLAIVIAVGLISPVTAAEKKAEEKKVEKASAAAAVVVAVKQGAEKELIEAVKKIQPAIKTIVFSIEDKSFRIKSLFNNLGINAYIAKGRNSIPELQDAIQRVYDNEENIISSELSHTMRDKSIFEIEAYDISLLKLLSKGHILDEIAKVFKESGISPNGSSSIEKRINRLKVYFKANNNVHLIAITKDLGLV